MLLPRYSAFEDHATRRRYERGARDAIKGPIPLVAATPKRFWDNLHTSPKIPGKPCPRVLSAGKAFLALALLQ